MLPVSSCCLHYHGVLSYDVGTRTQVFSLQAGADKGDLNIIPD